MSFPNQPYGEIPPLNQPGYGQQPGQPAYGEVPPAFGDVPQQGYPMPPAVPMPPMPPGAPMPPMPPMPPGQYPYLAPPMGMPYPAPPANNGMATASLVCSLLGILCGIGSILGVIFGHLAQSQIKRTGEAGQGLALAGMIIGYLGLAWMVLMLMIFWGGAAATSFR